VNRTSAPRYALYFAPAAEHPLWRAGCNWLGRDPSSGTPWSPPSHPELADPWRYGFHGTLKPPMRLRPGTAEADWLDAVVQVLRSHRRFDMPALRVAWLTDFLALRPQVAPDGQHPLRRLADALVVELDRWREPLSEAKADRRVAPHFSARQREQVRRFGYAHVLDDWRFHMSLTGSLHEAEPSRTDELLRQATSHFDAALHAPLACEDVCVFVQREQDQPFVLAHRVPLAAA